MARRAAGSVENRRRDNAFYQINHALVDLKSQFVISSLALDSRISQSKADSCIRVIRGVAVMLDIDLASLYGVTPKQLLQAMRRNRNRFPPDFVFQLTNQEFARLRSQIVTSNAPVGRGGRRYQIRAFTEQGVAMLSSVLRSDTAVRVNIEIMRAFVQLRRMLGANEELARKLDALEQKYDG